MDSIEKTKHDILRAHASAVAEVGIRKAGERTRVVIASPFAGAVRRNLEYLGLCIRHSVSLGEAPLAPHAMYPLGLDDQDKGERRAGMDCGLAWLASGACAALAVYVDLGVSAGMLTEIAAAQQLGVLIVRRTVPGYIVSVV